MDDLGRAQRGEVFTRPWVAELTLDLGGYVADADLAGRVVVEPACGTGAFLLPIVDRFVASARKFDRPVAAIRESVVAYDVDPANVDYARDQVRQRLRLLGFDARAAQTTAKTVVRQGDYLLARDRTGADFVFGNPPYVRIENIPAAVRAAYLEACSTMRGRSDLYVGFIELGLKDLNPGGTLGFIVADRWMSNQSGRALRQVVTDGFAVRAVVDMHEVDAFDDEVAAYPAITIIERGRPGAVVVARTDGTFAPRQAKLLARWSVGRRRKFVEPGVEARRLDAWFVDDAPWPVIEPAALEVLRDLEARHPLLEDSAAGTRVGVGVATGADEVFITNDTDSIELERLIPVVTASDTATGYLRWSGRFLINPWNFDGLVALDDHPQMAARLRRHEARLRGRHVAQRNPRTWYRTIDRIDPRLVPQAKLLLPDLKGIAHPVLDPGGHYPAHNLYFLVSDGWDLEVLGGILLSDVANLFVAAYSVRMRGGYLRFQAQYLRRIRVPAAASVPKGARTALKTAFRNRDRAAASAISRELYGVADVPGPRALR